MTRKIIRLLRMASYSVAVRRSRFIWRHFKTSKGSNSNFEAHLLVVKNASYARIVRICVESFLYWNPNSIVNIHCDDYTESEIKKWGAPKKFRQQIKIVPSYCDDSRSWQEQKLDLLISMNGKHDFFMDADLRWNGPLRLELNRPTFFVNEFVLITRSPYRQIVREHDYIQYAGSRMWNTSFFTFGGFKLSIEEIHKILSLHRKLLDTIDSDLFGDYDKPSLIRIAEQLALSMRAELWPIECGALKNIDGYKDGSFVESSYFGATGQSF